MTSPCGSVLTDCLHQGPLRHDFITTKSWAAAVVSVLVPRMYLDDCECLRFASLWPLLNCLRPLHLHSTSRLQDRPRNTPRANYLSPLYRFGRHSRTGHSSQIGRRDAQGPQLSISVTFARAPVGIAHPRKHKE